MNNSSCSVRKPPPYYIRTMVKSDIDEVLDIWKSIGLHEGTHTIDSFLEVDPDGFYVAINNEDESILGVCAAVFVNPNLGFVGLYAVRQEYQGLGIGTAIWKMAMDHAGDRNIGLYAVPEHLVTYRDRAGFRVEDDRLMVLYESDALYLDDLVRSIDHVKTSIIGDATLNLVIEYDCQIHGYSRDKLIRLIVQEQDSVSLVATDETDDGKVLGYGCFRTNNINKAMVGPLYADNDAVAELLVYKLIESFPVAKKNGLLFMTLDSNHGGIRIANKLRLDKHEELPRFFTKQVPRADFNRIYCIHTPNFSPF